jgi:hypothetical protein
MFSLKVPPVLHNKSLVLLLAARILTSIAFQMLTVAVGWQIYSITQMPIYLGLVGLVQFLPMVLLAFEKQWKLIYGQLIRVLRICCVI